VALEFFRFMQNSALAGLGKSLSKISKIRFDTLFDSGYSPTLAGKPLM
jgi:hypothetical protein